MKKTILIGLILIMLFLGIINVFAYMPALVIKDPANEAQILIKSIVTKKAAPTTSSTVIFSNGMSINSRSLAEASAGILSPENICISTGDFASNTASWESFNGIRVTYTGSEKKAVSLHGICDACSKISQQNYFERYDTQIEQEWLSDCNKAVFNEDNKDSTCCVLAIKISSGSASLGQDYSNFTIWQFLLLLIGLVVIIGIVLFGLMKLLKKSNQKKS